MKMTRTASWIVCLSLFWACSRDDLPVRHRQIVVPAERLAAAETIERGRSLFLRHCALCHGERADGSGQRQNLSVAAADLTDPWWQRRVSPRWVFYVVREGREGTPMPAWKGLGDDACWDLTAYVLSLGHESP